MKLFKNLKLLAVAAMLILPLATNINTGKAAALLGSDFKAGRIIDDQKFYDYQAMSAADIQSFLESKVPTCDTNGQVMYNDTQTRAQFSISRGVQPPFICLKDYKEQVLSKADSEGLCGYLDGGYKSASEIIYDVAQSCGINPQVLLVIIQKEQSLVTDDWPWPTQYQHATGFGCPDAANCPTDYKGFANQVYQTARYFSRFNIEPNQLNYKVGQQSYIQYNPNAICGGSNVLIENKATGSLYQYTPYQPNQAALNNLNGAGDSCSSYGNRNFWRYYNEWFGSSLATKPTVNLQANASGFGDNLSALPSGTYVNLNWNSQDASSCEVSPLGWSGNTGSRSTQIFATTTFTLSCSNSYGTTSQSITATVLPKPTAEISVNGGTNASVDYGDTVNINWKSDNTTSCTLNGVNVPATSGQIQERLTVSKQYKISCTGAYGTVVSQASVSVAAVTFAYLTQTIANAAAAGSLNSSEVQSITNQIATAEKASASNKKNAVTLLNNTVKEVNKLNAQGKISTQDQQYYTQAVQDLTKILNQQ